MELWRHVIAVVVSATLGNAATYPVTGYCCPTGKGGDGGCHGSTSGKFTPPIIAEQETAVSWTTHTLNCPLNHSVAYYDLDEADKGLVLKEDELMLSIRPRGLFRKERQEYCVEAYGEGYRGAICLPRPDRICGSAVCIPKCCGEGEVLKDFECIRDLGNMSLQFYSSYGKAIPAPPNVVMVADMVPDCGDGFPTSLDENSGLQLLENGNLLERETQTVHKFNHYCIENIYIEHAQTKLFLACMETESTAITVKHNLQRIGYVISVIFLVATILFHIFVKSLQDIQGICLISYMVSMAVVDIFLFILSVYAYDISFGFCVFSAFVLQYSFLAMFFWLNILCFDIWRVIRAATKPAPLLGTLTDDAKILRLYSLYGWGVPLLITVVSIILHSLPEEHARNVIIPGIGKEKCWFSGDLELFIYCYAYISALFILDCGFLGHTIFMLRKTGGACGCFTKQDSVTASNQQHFETFWHQFSLFILMVLCWTTELLSWKVPPEELWILSDFVNSLQGLLVFIIFISNRKRREKVIKLLKRVPLPCCKSLNQVAPANDSHGSTNWRDNSSSVSLSGPSATQRDISLQESLNKPDSSDNK